MTAKAKNQLNSVIALEGNIGAGKSTICASFKRLEPSRCSVYKEKGNEQFLNLFYKDPAKYGFAYQWGMLKTRRFQHSLALRDSKYGRDPNKPKDYYFWDRSMVGDYIFALWNHLLGGISKEEMEVYENEFGGSIRRIEELKVLTDVSCYILLDDEPLKCKYRVENLRGNASEKSIPIEYYDGIDDIHFELFVRRIIPHKISKVLVLSWGQYDDPRAIWDSLKDIVTTNPAAVSSVQFEPEFDANNLSDEETKVYKTKEEVLESYLLFSKFEKQLTATVPKDVSDSPSDESDHSDACLSEDSENYDKLVGAKHIYIPEDIMEISSKEKGVIENDYGVRFYENPYKRVVLKHLSNKQTLHFYTLNK